MPDTQSDTSPDGYRDRHYLLRSFLGLPLCNTRITRPSFLYTPQMNPSLPSGRSVIVCLRIAVALKDRLAIIPSLPHTIRVAEYNGLGNP